MNSELLLKMENVNKRYGKIHAVKDVNLSINKREIVGLIGNNGAGKSTLIKTLIGVTTKTSGRFYWLGKRVEIKSVKDSRELGIEAVYQEQALFNKLSISKNVFMDREPEKTIGPFKIIDYKKMNEIIKPLFVKLKLNIPSLEREVRFCSGGERQGVAIARAMHFKAKLVILDEPTNALSVHAVRKVLSFIEQLKNNNTSVIFISHNIEHVYSVADRIVVMSHGKKVFDINKANKSKDDIEKLLTDLSV